MWSPTKSPSGGGWKGGSMRCRRRSVMIPRPASRALASIHAKCAGGHARRVATSNSPLVIHGRAGRRQRPAGPRAIHAWSGRSPGAVRTPSRALLQLIPKHWNPNCLASPRPATAADAARVTPRPRGVLRGRHAGSARYWQASRGFTSAQACFDFLHDKEYERLGMTSPAAALMCG